ncbi:Transposable element P transposase-like Protein [Tribolium castaneum]|uniref:Transposable element P transposase-like Protein n=1 Tax=Tribolium castaneum TaxID=7070 RepID=D6WJV6_TRICA|nr:Transposable element P transposase-like Protein [Tribolium castaneum]
MKVNLAVQLFSPKVTAALRYLEHHGGDFFRDCGATVTYMENMYKYFQIHDVSNKKQYVEQRDSNTAPYTESEDERLLWLNSYFPNYIANIQVTSAEAGMTGLSNETAEALVFTAISTAQCVKYLISDLNFYYVLTRKFNSDAVESIFSNVRLRGGSNDITDCRAAEYALRQILRTGFIKNVDNTNTISDVGYTSSATLNNSQQLNEDPNQMTITLSNDVIKKLEELSTCAGNFTNFASIESGAIGFLCGYLLKKVEESVKCATCLMPLSNHSALKTSPLLELIYNQDRGKLKYPSEKFIGLICNVIEVTLEIIPSVPTQNVEHILNTVIVSYLKNNPMFSCEEHHNVCKIIVGKLIPALLTNFCNLHTQRSRKQCYIYSKKRKLLKGTKQCGQPCEGKVPSLIKEAVTVIFS